MASPRNTTTGELEHTASGTPLWQKIVYYYVESNPATPGLGRLIRKEGLVPGLPSANAIASTFPPSTAPFIDKRWRVVAQGIYMPRQRIEPLGRDLDARGGFIAFFSDATGNSTSTTDFQRLHLVNVTLLAGEVSKSSGKLSVLELPIKMVPRN
jgi:hypothetical protein